jgi:diacylglycerol kinase
MPKKFIRSFKYAQVGALHILATQRNIRIHLAAGMAAVVLALWLGISRVEIAVLALAIAFVVVVEMINTAIEEAVNLVQPGEHPLAGMIKNIAAAAVLTAAFASLVIGLLIFVPRLIELWPK